MESKYDWLKAICPICGKEYRHLRNYKPKTCSNFMCLYTYWSKHSKHRKKEVQSGTSETMPVLQGLPQKGKRL